MTGHGNPAVRLQPAEGATVAVVGADAAGRALRRSHPLPPGHVAACVDVRDGRCDGSGRGGVGNRQRRRRQVLLPEVAFTVSSRK